ncbi:MAG: ABC transporter permease [Sporomusaceae bacterium]|nr:ABC transporter permease [Sporomusaceae bacterium]
MELTPQSFQPLARTEGDQEHFTPGLSSRQAAWRRLKANQLAMAGLYLILFFLLVALIGPFFSFYSYSDQNLLAANEPPSAAHWFGTDNLGRDLFVRVLYGARISLAIGIVASFINLTIGVIYGGVSGFFGGRVDRIMMGIVDILYGIPLLLYVIVLMVVLKPGLSNIFIALGIAYWLNMARVVRSQILTLKEQEYILAAQTMGVSRWRILYNHLLPNCLGPILITMTLAIPEAIFTEAFLSFIGLGVAAPMASWGVLASEGITSIRSYPFQLLFPALAISLTMLAFNFLGDGLRDALDPRVRR